MSASQAEQHLVIFQKVILGPCCSHYDELMMMFVLDIFPAGISIQDHLDAIDQSRQTYLIAVGTRKSSIHAYFIILNKRALHVNERSWCLR